MNNNLIEISLPKIKKDTKLNPDFVTGLVEAEGSFSITKHKDDRARQKMTIGLRLEISMLSNEIELLYRVKDFFGCHTIEGNPEYIPISGYYINGFIAGNGCLALKTMDSDFGRMCIQISQHKNNRLLCSIANYFKSPNKIYYHDTSYFKWY